MNLHRKPVIRARARVGAPAALALLLTLSATPPASALVSLAPWGGDIAYVSSKSVAGGVEDLQSMAPPGLAPWSGMPFSNAHNDTTDANAFAFMTLATSFKDSIFAVTSSGTASTDGPATSNRGGALVYVQFVVEHTQSFITYPNFTAGNLASSQSLAFIANLASADLAAVPILPVPATSGRLAPGLYIFYFQNYYRDETATGNANSASAQVGFFDVPSPLVTQHPQNQTVAPGASVSFSVGAGGLSAAIEGTAGTLAAASPSAPLAVTYRWRYRYQNLTDGGRISGATTNQLHIANVAVADTGVYDCVLTQGPIQEPSSLARLTVTGSSAVEDAPLDANLSLSTPAPSPFSSRTLVRFALPAETSISLDVLDVGGRRVRSLVSHENYSAGSHAIEWDGRSERGERSPSGIYFVRLQAGSEWRVQRVVRLAR